MQRDVSVFACNYEFAVCFSDLRDYLEAKLQYESITNQSVPISRPCCLESD